MSAEKTVFSADLNGVHIHFTGIKGTGMTALVEICLKRGAIITGSDVADRFYTDKILEKLGVRARLFDAGNITDSIELVVHSSAYKREENPELIEADRRKIPVIQYTQALGALSALAYSCAIAGVHGKTTTTGITGSILKSLSFPVQVLAGSAIAGFDGSCVLTQGNGYFVAETCEYQRHFMSFFPKKILLTSVESDHQDFYPTYESIRDAFVDFALRLPERGQLIYCADDPGAYEVARLAKERRGDLLLIPYGEQAQSVYKLRFGDISGGCQHFTLEGFDGTWAIQIPGKHTVRNAAGSLALCAELLKTDREKNGVSASKPFETTLIDRMKTGLLNFSGSKRRCEILGKTGNILFIDDYGHHPTAVKTTLQGLRDFYPERRLVVDFMSHTYSRTLALMDEFASSFSAADEVILHKVYASAREAAPEQDVGKMLYEKTAAVHPRVSYFPEISGALEYVVSSLREGDLFVTMGAGDNWKLGVAVLERLSGKKAE